MSRQIRNSIQLDVDQMRIVRSLLALAIIDRPD